jgi:hypothetical protein
MEKVSGQWRSIAEVIALCANIDRLEVDAGLRMSAKKNPVVVMQRAHAVTCRLLPTGSRAPVGPSHAGG